MENVVCITCEDYFAITSSNAKRVHFEQQPYLRHLDLQCPYCHQSYKLFTDVDSDKLLAQMGIGLRWTSKPAPEGLEVMFNEQFFPDVDEEVVAKFIDQVEAYSGG